jgi:8-oxo-dGTP diphosphatase
VEPGRDYVGLGVGAVIPDAEGRFFLSRRGPATRNEPGAWEFPGGMVSYGEPLEEAIRREIDEEFGMTIEITDQIGAFDDILPAEHQHWVSVVFLARHIGGEPAIREPGKSTEIGWFTLDTFPNLLSVVTTAGALLLRG